MTIRQDDRQPTVDEILQQFRIAAGRHDDDTVDTLLEHHVEGPPLAFITLFSIAEKNIESLTAGMHAIFYPTDHLGKEWICNVRDH